MNQSTLIARLQAGVYVVRRGQWERVLATLTLVSLGVGEWSRRVFNELPQISYAAYGTFVLAALWLVLRVWKKAVPPPMPGDKPLPNAIKGLLPFTASDGALFARLGRSLELQAILAPTQDDQVGISVVRGESGAGKTSLLQAGLAYTIGKERCIYWEAVAANAPNALLHAIRSQIPGLDTLNGLDSLPEACLTRCVLILDQFEQLRSGDPDHASIFSLLERIAKAPPPHRLAAVVGFRREYVADWLDFEQTHGFRAEQVPVNLLAQTTAEDVLVTLSTEAGFTLDQALVKSFIAGATQTKADRPQGVSPVDVAIGVFGLANFVQQAGISHVGIKEYELSGGAEGLLLSFVQQKLEEIPEALRAPLLKGIVLALVDPANDQRIAEGETSAVIAARAESPESSIVPSLERLAHPRIRLLERCGPNRYRLPHERLVPLLRRLAGQALVEDDQLRLLFEDYYAKWRGTHSRRHLLGGRDLRGVLRQRHQLILGQNTPGKTEYLAACLRRRSLLRVGAGAVGISIAAVWYGTVRALDAAQQRQALQNWGLPPELFSAQSGLDALVIGAAINELGWLRSPQLRDLTVTYLGNNLGGLARLRGLEGLTLNLPPESQITGLAGLESLESLRSLTLALRSLKMTSLAGLERVKGLKSLHLDLTASRIVSLAGLEQLTRLTALTLIFKFSLIRSLAELEQLTSLTTLRIDMDGDPLRSLDELGKLKWLKSLALNVVGIQFDSLGPLAHLQDLTSLGLNLAGSRITDLVALETLSNVTSLELILTGSKINTLADLGRMRGLTTLSIGGPGSLAGLSQLKQLTSLTVNLSGTTITSLAGLERLTSLTSLTLNLVDSALPSLSGLEKLQGLSSLTLNLAGSRIISLAVLDELKNLTSLNLAHPASVAGLEKLKALTSLTVNLGGSGVNALGDLVRMKSLTSITINTAPNLRSLENLPNLTSLRVGSVNSMVGLEQLTNLTSLTLGVGPGIDRLSGLNQLRRLTSLTLYLKGSQVTNLTELEQLNSLDGLEIWMPLGLVSHAAQLKTAALHRYLGCQL
jgi:hypothetical protein